MRLTLPSSLGALQPCSQAGGGQVDTKQRDVRASQAGNFLRQHAKTLLPISVRMAADRMTTPATFDIPFVACRQESAPGWVEALQTGRSAALSPPRFSRLWHM